MNNLQKYKEDYKKLKEYGEALQYGFIFEYKKHPSCKKIYLIRILMGQKNFIKMDFIDLQVHYVA